MRFIIYIFNQSIIYLIAFDTYYWKLISSNIIEIFINIEINIDFE